MSKQYYNWLVDVIKSGSFKMINTLILRYEIKNKTNASGKSLLVIRHTSYIKKAWSRFWLKFSSCLHDEKL